MTQREPRNQETEFTYIPDTRIQDLHKVWTQGFKIQIQPGQKDPEFRYILENRIHILDTGRALVQNSNTARALKSRIQIQTGHYNSEFKYSPGIIIQNSNKDRALLSRIQIQSGHYYPEFK